MYIFYTNATTAATTPGTDVCTERGTGLTRRAHRKKKKNYTTRLDLYTIALNSIKKAILMI